MSRQPEQRADVADTDLTGETAVVTGSTSGIGREMALALGRLGAHVVVHGRDRERGETVAADLRETAGDGEFVAADFASLDSVREFAATITDRHGTVSYLFNNAGGLFRTGDLTPDGIERTFAVNHLAPFVLTHCLLPAMSEGGRVVTTSSGAHRSASIDFESLRSVEGYSGMTAYAQSKLANVLFTRELARRTDRVTANCFHPGFVPGSDFFRELPAPVRIPMSVASVVPGFGTSVKQGAARGLYVGVSEEVADISGKYFGAFSESTPSSAARDDETARRLWAVSEDLTDIEESQRLASPQPH
jgi:hypothetical protein